MGKAAGTRARELSTGGQGARRDEGRSREGAVRMVRRSRSRKLQKLTGLCRREEGLRVRGEGGEAKGGQQDGSQRSGEELDKVPGRQGGVTHGPGGKRWQALTTQSWE